MPVSTVDAGGGQGGEASSNDTHPDTKRFDPNSHWKDAPNKKCFSSFGDGGTTATVSASGDIMQFSKYIGGGHSGMFSADHKCVAEPYWVIERTADLQNLIGRSRYDEETTYGAQFPELESLLGPELTYVHNRWPQFDDVLAHDWEGIYREKYGKFENLDHLHAHLRSESSGMSKFSATWMVHQGIVFQHCVASNNSFSVPLKFNVQFQENMLIRDLDHLHPESASDPEREDNYFTFLGPQKQSWVRLHQYHGVQGGQSHERQGNEEVTTDSVAVVVSVFINDQLQSWTRTATDTEPDNATGSSHSDTPNNINNAETVRNEGSQADGIFKWSHTVEPGEKVGITFAYEMYHTQDGQHKMGNSFGHVEESLIATVREILGGKSVEETFSLASMLPITNGDSEVLPETQLNKTNNPDRWSVSSLEDPSGEISSMSPINHLDFFARRNLEHILSVCAIPIHSDNGRLKGLEKLGIQPVALTCGDMAFHRVNTGASFFAFEFLIETAKRLQQPYIANHGQVKSLLERIQQICIGHLLWVLSISLGNQPFAANYWVSGAKMNATHAGTWQPKDSPTDSAYQLIKIQECLDVFGKVLQEHKKAISDALQPAATAWRQQLKFLDAKDDCAWPHAQEEGINTFRLDDHIWIWRGLRALESIEDSRGNSENTVQGRRNKASKLAKEQKAFDSRNVQQKIIRHFTTRNEILAKRTLAVTRSSRENRFLFHSRDTVLLYATEWGFISDGDLNAKEVWQNAMLAQPEHEENQEFTWKSALHYALSILMALKGFSIDKRPPSDMIKDSLATLAQTSSPNGLFPGLLDKTTKKDDLFHREADRDFYFHAGFEISFILFANTNKIIDTWKPKTVPSQERNGINQEALTKAVEYIAERISQQSLKGTLESNIAYVPDDVHNQNQRSRFRTSAMKKSMPVSLSIDADNVVDVDDEWMYNYPGFLASVQTAGLKFKDAVQNLGQTTGLRETPKETEWKNRMLEKSPANTTNSEPKEKAVALFDITTKSRVQKGEATKGDPRMLDVEELWEKLRNPRTEESPRKRFVKKRFVWLKCNEKDIALCCYAGSHDDEKTAISMFFDRNAKAEQFFHDETTRFLNMWETELHLSFYQLFSSGDSALSGKDTSRGMNLTFPRNGGYTIAKASIGFRFSGDFFDRFWTCHLIEPTSKEHSRWDLWLKDPSAPHRTSKQKAWGQRKVLELHLFDRILTTLVDRTRRLFETSKKAVDLERYGKQNFLLNYKNINYSESSGDWEDLQQSFKHIIDELERVDGTIVKWQTREKDRGTERPRWTRYDETKYRGDINKLKVSTNHKIQEFRSLHLEIKSFRDWLMRYQEQIREEAAFRGSENIKFFTYVTVVFLPLGFASSIFSMSGVPEQHLIGNMATMAIVALLITVLAILSAPAVKFVFDRALENSLKRWKENSILFELNARSIETQSATNTAEATSEESTQSLSVKQEAHADEAALNRANSIGDRDITESTNAGDQQYSQPRRGGSNISIWLWYVFTELPAQIVISAYEGMSGGHISATIVFTVVLGIVVLPWCLITLMARVIAVNLADLIHIISSLTFHTFAKIFNSQERPKKPLEFLLEPSDKLRPFKAARDKFSKQGKGEAV